MEYQAPPEVTVSYENKSENIFFKDLSHQKKLLTEQHIYQLNLKTEIRLKLMEKNYSQQNYLKS